MADWEEDSERLRANIVRALSRARDRALQRNTPTLDDARSGHLQIMRGLAAPVGVIGRFRGEPGLEDYDVAVGRHAGVASGEVANALRTFEERLQKAVALLDAWIKPEAALTTEQLSAVLDLCAWAHSEWVRIHPFANGNGRTARLWANALAMRYGLRPFVPVRPRPGKDYAVACATAMDGDWRPAARVFRRMYREAIGN